MSMFLTIAGMALQGVSMLAQSAAQRRQGKTAEAVAKYNAQVAENEAIAARQAAQARAEQAREEGRRVIGMQRARYGAAGITQEGSPLLTMLDTAAQTELDALRVVHGGELRARAFEQRAELERFYGRRAREAGGIGAGTTLLTGFAGLGQQFGKFGKTQGWWDY